MRPNAPVRAKLQHLNQLRIRLEEEGLFKVNSTQLFLEVFICLAASLLSYFLYPQFPVIAVVVQTIACIHIVWWIHDAGHQAFFKSERFSKICCEVLGQLYLGMPQLEYHFDIHRQHHRESNHIHKDPALQTGPITWHEVQRQHEPKWFSYLRPILWLLIVLPLTWPIMTFNCMRLLLVNGNLLRLILALGRWSLFVFLFSDRMPLLLIPALVAGLILGLSASLNHFHMPIWTQQVPWLNRVFLSTQNICPDNKALGWLMGGLNCHIEHHLFPRMPSRNLAKASVHVKSFAEKLDMPYHTRGLLPSLHALTKKLAESDTPELIDQEAS